MTTTVATRLDDATNKDLNFLAKAEHTDKSTIVRRILIQGVANEKLRLAMERYRLQKISIGKAAELAGLSVADMLVQTSQSHIPVNYTKENLLDDINAV